MPSIAFFTQHHAFPWARQLQPADALPGGWRFTLAEEAADCALLVVYDDPPEGFATHLPRERRLVVLSEPPGIKTYRPGFLEQFGLVLGPIEPTGARGPHWLRGQAGLPWFYGIGFGAAGLVANLSVDDLAGLPVPAKQPDVSVVITRKSQLPKHRARLAFVEALKKRLGPRLQIFGRGFAEISDKAEAIDPFAYHLVLENNDIADFFTEKTADAYLGWALPIFSGCANLGAHFPADSFVPIDIGRTSDAIARIERLLDEHPHASRLPAIAEARRRLIGPLNLRHRLIEIAEGLGGMAPAHQAPEAIRPTVAFDLLRRLRKAAAGLRK